MTHTTPTGNPFLDSISWAGTHWEPVGAGPLEITYYFANDYTYAWAPEEIAAFEAALAAWAAVTAFTIREVATEGEAILIAHTLSDAEMTTEFGSGVFGVHFTPADAVADGTGQAHGYFNWEGYSFPEGGFGGYDPGGLVPGGWGFYTFLHELGHGLGFSHPHDTGGGSPIMPGVTSPSSTGSNNLNQGLNTVMSYNAGATLLQDALSAGLADYGYNTGLGAFDIALAQLYYGANTTAASGDDTYVLPEAGGWLSIWDTGGTDTIRYDGSADAVINLNSATLQDTPMGGGMPSHLVDGATQYYGGYTIAADITNALPDLTSSGAPAGISLAAAETGVIIENAVGGSGDDMLTGNGVGNLLKGRAGADTIEGGSGSDILVGGAGEDELRGGGDGDTLLGQGNRDLLLGGGGDDILLGGDGNDVIKGGTGDGDRMYGQSGKDSFVFSDGHGADKIKDFQDDIDTLWLNDSLWTGVRTVQEVLDDFAVDLGNDVLLDFGGGDTLRLNGVLEIADLADDIIIF